MALFSFRTTPFPGAEDPVRSDSFAPRISAPGRQISIEIKKRSVAPSLAIPFMMPNPPNLFENNNLLQKQGILKINIVIITYW